MNNPSSNSRLSHRTPVAFVNWVGQSFDVFPAKARSWISLLIAVWTLTLFTNSVIAQDPVNVEIRSVDSVRRSVNVQYGDQVRTLAVAADAVIIHSGKSGDLRSLLPGDQASVVYDREAAQITRIEARRSDLMPAEKPDPNARWDEVDERLVFLMVRLASLEASLDAIESALDAANRKSGRKAAIAQRADKNNEDMDRKGGGPMRWSLFYGTTAEKFFYHPTDRNSTYHTVTVLSQKGSQADNKVGGGVPASQGLPVHQRPPQFDYIYRANDSAKIRAEAEVAKLGGNVTCLASLASGNSIE